MKKYKALYKKVAKRLLKMHFEAGVGHIGGNLSCLDILLTLHHDVMNKDDQFILSKGHAAGAYYVTLWSLKKLKDSDLKTFHGEGTRLAGHIPSDGVPGVLFGTGSLGHGPGLAAGLGLAKQLKGEPGRVYCLTSDGEWDEGSCWEALAFIERNKIQNVTIIVDKNNRQGFYPERYDLSIPFFYSCHIDTFDNIELFNISGHSNEEMIEYLNKFKPSLLTSSSLFVVANTVKGKGVSFMENELKWHYMPMDKHQYNLAIKEIDAMGDTDLA